MNAIEIRDLHKNFGAKQAVNGLNMTVPQGAIYGLIGENGSGKSTTEKLISGLLVPGSGTIKIFGRDYREQDVREKLGLLIESPGCFPDMSVWNNMLLQSANLGLKEPHEAIRRVLRLVRMEGAASNKYKNCSLGMKQRIGIAFALLGEPELLILDEPINGLDADGMRILREVLVELTREKGCTVLISSHVLGELEKIATHYGIVRGGRMIAEMTAEELDARCPRYLSIRADDMSAAQNLLARQYSEVSLDESGALRVYGDVRAEEVEFYLYRNGVTVSEVRSAKINLEEFYSDLLYREGKYASENK